MAAYTLVCRKCGEQFTSNCVRRYCRQCNPGSNYTDKERNETIVSMRNNGHSVAEIAILYDLSTERIRQIIRMEEK